MAAELQNAEKVISHAARPFTAIMGGAKVSDKIELIERLLEKVDHLIIYLYEVKYSGTQDTGSDPDKECDSWEHIDPNTVVDKLHVPMDRNVALKYYIDN